MKYSYCKVIVVIRRKAPILAEKLAIPRFFIYFLIRSAGEPQQEKTRMFGIFDDIWWRLVGKRRAEARRMRAAEESSRSMTASQKAEARNAFAAYREANAEGKEKKPPSLPPPSRPRSSIPPPPPFKDVTPPWVASKGRLKNHFHEAGDVLPDGWIYVGLIPYKSGFKGYSISPVWMTERDINWKQVQKYLKRSNKEGQNIFLPNIQLMTDMYYKLIVAGYNDVAQFTTEGAWWVSDYCEARPFKSLTRFYQGSWQKGYSCESGKYNARFLRVEPTPLSNG